MIQYLSLSSANPLLSLKWVKLCAFSTVRWFDKVPENLSEVNSLSAGRIQSDLQGQSLDFVVVIIIVGFENFPGKRERERWAGQSFPEIFTENVLTRSTTSDFRTGDIYGPISRRGHTHWLHMNLVNWDVSCFIYGDGCCCCCCYC